MTKVEESAFVDQPLPARGLVMIRLLYCVTFQEPLECLGSSDLTFQKTPFML